MFLVAGGAILGDNEQGTTGEPSVKVEYVDNGYEQKYNDYFNGVGVDVDHFKAFVSAVDDAAADKVISKAEYATLSSMAAEAATTADFPRTEMETAVLNNAIYDTELAQYDEVKGMVDARFADKNLVSCRIETGRTHQIRVHFKYIGYPLVGDPMYGQRKVIGDNGQFLHAHTLGFVHPRTNEYLEFSVDLPEYFKEYIKQLENETK